MRSCAFFVLLLGVFCSRGLVPPAAGQSVADMTDRPVALRAVAGGAAKAGQAAFAAAAVPVPFDGLVVRGYAADGRASGWIRFPQDAGDPGWQPLYTVFSATGGTFLAAYRGAVLRRDAPFELRFDVTPGVDFHLDEAGVFDSRRDDDRPGPAAATPRAEGSASGGITPPALIRRMDWGAQPFRGTPDPLARPSYNHMTLHHAAGFGAKTKAEGLEQLRRIQDFHQNGRGWSDIGYQFVVDEAGNVYQGRPFLDESKRLADAPALAMGAHAGGANTGNIGLCVLGCYHPAEGAHCADVLSPAARDSIVTMFGFLADAYGVAPANLKGHRDFGSTACPGDNNYALLPTLRDRVTTLLATGNQAVGTATLTARVRPHGVVQLEWIFLEDRGITRYRVERVSRNQVTVLYEGEGAVPDGFMDRTVAAPGPVVYRLFASGAGGKTHLLAVVEAEVTPPERATLASVFPNPVSGTASIRYYLERDAHVRLRVFDAGGREVQSLAADHQEGGLWHVRSVDTSRLANGLYFYKLEVEGFSGLAYAETFSFVVLR